VGLPLTAEAIDDFVAKYGTSLTCLAFMGGDNDPRGVDHLAEYIHEEYPELRVAWYSGRTVISALINKDNFDYIKIGPYIKHLGPLKKPTTNQRLYRRTDEGDFEDITARFWKK
jgi:anaerobic ribonucleoside-triphosphate reductase activating protein